MEWSYGLNTANYQTYGGEVVQILSCFIEDMTISGTTNSYRQLEKIYAYFIDYIQIATTDAAGASYDPRPIIMHYPHRNWTFEIHPKSLPSFKYGRDVVAPTWTIVAAVAEPDQDMVAKIMDRSAIEALRSNGPIKLFGTVTGDIGYKSEDPFRTPFVDTGKKKGKDKEDAENSGIRNMYGDLGDWFNNLIPSYLKGDFQDLAADYSQPAFGQPDLGQNKPGKTPGGGKDR